MINTGLSKVVSNWPFMKFKGGHGLNKEVIQVLHRHVVCMMQQNAVQSKSLHETCGKGTLAILGFSGQFELESIVFLVTSRLDSNDKCSNCCSYFNWRNNTSCWSIHCWCNECLLYACKVFYSYTIPRLLVRQQGLCAGKTVEHACQLLETMILPCTCIGAIIWHAGLCIRKQSTAVQISKRL